MKAFQAAGTPVPSQRYGDCQEVQCDGNGNAKSVPKDDDAFDDGNDCTGDICTDGILSHVNWPQGATCSGSRVCDGAGKCLQCLGSTKPCSQGKMCVEGLCIGSNCANNTKDPGEGDIDCGGACLPCADGRACTVSTQCASGVCTSGLCATATCTDMVKNGVETDIDCGGPDCKACPADSTCTKDADCQSGVCMSAFCAAPSCTDAVQNGNETGVDCGGSCPTLCSKP